MSRPSFRCVGGSVMWGSVDLSEHDVKALIALYRDEAKAAWAVQDHPTHELAATLHGELYTASIEALRWARAGSLTNTQRAA